MPRHLFNGHTFEVSLRPVMCTPAKYTHLPVSNTVLHWAYQLQTPVSSELQAVPTIVLLGQRNLSSHA